MPKDATKAPPNVGSVLSGKLLQPVVTILRSLPCTAFERAVQSPLFTDPARPEKSSQSFAELESRRHPIDVCRIGRGADLADAQA